MSPDLYETEDLVIFTEELLNGVHHFLWSLKIALRLRDRSHFYIKIARDFECF